MLIIARCIAGFLSAYIVLSWPLCAWAFWNYLHRTDPTRGESLMVLPGTGFGAGILGIAITIVVLLNHDRMSRLEKAVFWTIAASGIALFMGVFALLIFIDLY